jgi:hypothetical protein
MECVVSIIFFYFLVLLILDQKRGRNEERKHKERIVGQKLLHKLLREELNSPGYRTLSDDEVTVMLLLGGGDIREFDAETERLAGEERTRRQN